MNEWYRTKRFWIIAVIIALIVMVFMSGQFVVKCFRWRRDIAALTKEVEIYRAKIAEDSGEYTVSDVITGLCAKLIRRHTHIFGDVKATTPEEALVAWQNAKKLEKEQSAK